MKLLLTLLLLIPVSCTQGEKRDGGWASKRVPNTGSAEKQADGERRARNRQAKAERRAAENSEAGTGSNSNTDPKTSGSQPASHIPAPRSAPVYAPNAPMVVLPLPANPLINYTFANRGDDFSVDFAGPGQLIPPGLIYGMNDLRNASAGVWKSWADAVTPTGGLMRLWVKYSMVPFENKHIEAAKRAQEAGLTVMVTAVGNSREKGRHGAAGGNPTKIPDPKVWSQEVIRDIKRLRASGVSVTHVEIWNEPNLESLWPGSVASFGDWYAEVGGLLREEFEDGLQIGGPGLAGTLGEKLEWCQEMFRASKEQGFQPDFYSWHQYGGSPTEHDMLQVPQLILNEAVQAGIEPPQLMLSEWNIGLPSPNLPALDDERAAHYYLATTISLARTQVSNSTFFFLQDAPWDTRKELAGESVGVFTLAGAPKAVLSGMRMMATAADLPAHQVKREGAPANISLFASRKGNQGYLLAVNTFGGAMDRHTTRLLRRAGIDISSLKKQAKLIQGYVYGKKNESSLRRLNLDSKTMDAINVVRDEVMTLEAESKKGYRTVRIRLEGKPKSIKMVQLLDHTNGNPRENSEFQRAYAPYSKGLNGPAGEATMVRLRAEGLSESTLSALEKGMKGGKASGVDRATTRHAQEVFQEELLRLGNEVPETLSILSCSSAQEVEADAWCTLQDDILELRLPLESSVLIELAW